jgi:hypothetical protein
MDAARTSVAVAFSTGEATFFITFPMKNRVWWVG